MLLSVVIPFYKYKNYLKECLNSLLNSSFHDFETILVLDHNEEKIEDLLEEYKELKIRVIENRNHGVASSRNLGIKYANGDYVSLDDFEISMQKKNDEIESLKRQVEKLESIRMRCHESARDSFDSGNYGCLHIVTADELKTTKDVNDRTIELPFDALETANMLINAEYSEQTSSIEKAFTGCNVVKGDIYSVDDLEQIAEHLLVYCKHNKESEE